MLLSSLENKSIIFVGFEATNRALYREIRRRFSDLNLAVADRNAALELPDDDLLEAFLGPSYLSSLSEFDVIVRSPGVPYHKELKRVKARVTTATNLFFEEVRAKTSAKIIGVTGTKGKSTTTTLIYEVLKAAGEDALLLGNIDIQDWDAIPRVKNATTIVYEMSSYMLEDFTGRPDIAVWTTLFPDHMDWHGSFEAYTKAKSNITARQRPDDVLIAPESIISQFKTKAKKVAAGFSLRHDRAWFYDGDIKLFETAAVHIPGAHNLDNILLVLAAARELGILADIVEGVVRAFKGLPHRLEFVAEKNGVKFYDDAISTTPESTLAAIETFGEKLGGIILGGQDRGYDYSMLAKRLVELKVPVVVLLPGAREKIESIMRGKFLKSLMPPFQIFHANDMPSAVSLLAANVPSGKVALLSTAAPSYDLFKNYKDKGEQFQKEILKQGNKKTMN